MPELSHRVQTFTDSVIRRMTRISDEVNAINLSQGFPDFPPPKPITDRLREVADEGPHQYSVTFGAENFREALARKQGRAYGRTIDPDTEILVTCGGTEAMMSAMMTVCNPGDKVIVFSPFYENYGADAILSGADPIFVPLVPPTFDFDRNVLEDAFRQHPKAIIVCNPSNPCGKVFTKEELLFIGGLCNQYDAYMIADEVYEHIVFAPYHLLLLPLQDVFHHRMASWLPHRAEGRHRRREESSRLPDRRRGCSASGGGGCRSEFPAELLRRLDRAVYPQASGIPRWT